MALQSFTSLTHPSINRIRSRTRSLCYRWTRRRMADQAFALNLEDHVPTIAAMQHSSGGLIDVQELAQTMREDVRLYVQQCRIKPKLVGILANRSKRGNNQQWRQNDNAEIYSSHIQETLHEDGMQYELVRCSANSAQDIEQTIREVNLRNDVHGILVFYPIFKGDRPAPNAGRGPYMSVSTGVYYKTPDDYLRDTVSPAKDVEALGTGYNARWLFRARKQLSAEPYIPCTVQAVLKILETYYTHDAATATNTESYARLWSGMSVTVVNRSEILGRPLAALMALRGANVFSVDESSVLQFLPGGRLRRCHKTLRDCLLQSSIVVTAVPSPDFTLPSDSIQRGAIVINVAEHSNVDETSLLARPGVKFVPQVGSCTVAALEQNLIRLYMQQMKLR